MNHTDPKFHMRKIQTRLQVRMAASRKSWRTRKMMEAARRTPDRSNSGQPIER